MASLVVWFFTILIQMIASKLSLPGVAVFKNGDGGFPCHRAPSIVSTNNGTLVAFAMCRPYTGDGCNPTTNQSYSNISDPPNGYLCSKRSVDGGQTWSNISFPFGLSYYSRVGASIYDSFNNQIIFQSNVYDQTSNASIFQLTSNDDGITWNDPPIDVGRLYLDGVASNHLLGPGNGLQLKNGRILFIAHHESQDEGADVDRIWYSDDFGKTYLLSPTLIQNMNEGTLVELNNGSVMANMRNKNQFGTAQCDQQSHCRGIVMSDDNGTTFTAPYPCPALIGPVCQGSLISNEDGLYFSNPNSTTSRVNMTVKRSTDNGNSWNDGYLVLNGKAAYSCLTRMKGTTSNDIGLLFETESENCNGASCQIRFTTIPSDF